MAETYSFFEEGIKSYIEQSISKYYKNPEIIFQKDFDNTILNPLFINDITLFKNLIQKNKLKCEIWKSLGILFYQKISDISNIFNDSINSYNTKILQYKERIKKSNSYIEYLNERTTKRKEQIKYNIDEDIKRKKNEKNEEIKLNEENESEKEDNLEDVNCEEYNSKNNAKLIEKISNYQKKIDEETKNVENNEKKIKYKKKKIILGNINLLKLKILNLCINILINEININEIYDTNYSKENNYLNLNEYIDDLIEKCETNKEKYNINYISFVKSFIIELVLIINNQGYKDINKYFLNQLLSNIKNNQKKYSSNEISKLIIYIDKLLKNPDSFLCPNAFSILKNASYRKIRPRSRNNSFDKNDNNNNELKNNKNEKNSKIDDYFKPNKTESDEEEDDYAKKISSIISFKNSNQNNNNNLNNFNFHSQLSFGLNENNNSGIKFNSLSSAISNNSLLGQGGINYQFQTSNLLNSSKLSDDSMSMPHDSLAGTGINSRLVSQLPILRNTQKQKNKKNPVDKFIKKLENECSPYKKNDKDTDNFDKIINKEIRDIVNDKFYSNEIPNEEKNKNTTASDTKKSSNNILSDDNQTFKLEDKNKTKINDILVSKTPIKLICINEDLKEVGNNENLPNNGIMKNLTELFNQQVGK